MYTVYCSIISVVRVSQKLPIGQRRKDFTPRRIIGKDSSGYRIRFGQGITNASIANLLVINHRLCVNETVKSYKPVNISFITTYGTVSSTGSGERRHNGWLLVLVLSKENTMLVGLFQLRRPSSPHLTVSFRRGCLRSIAL